jgi:hypothetical protein
MSLAEYPGFPLLSQELGALLVRAENGDDAARPALLEKVADVLNVFIGLDLLQYVFMPTPEEDGSEPITIDPSRPQRTMPPRSRGSISTKPVTTNSATR